jgi:hypothetical protein
MYLVVTNSGGVDGRDSSDMGGKVMWAGWDRARMPRQYAKDIEGHAGEGWYRLEMRIVDAPTARAAALQRLTHEDRLLLGLTREPAWTHNELANSLPPGWTCSIDTSTIRVWARDGSSKLEGTPNTEQDLIKSAWAVYDAPRKEDT